MTRTTKRSSVAVHADAGSVLNLLAHTFTESTTFVKEMLQNARRAGATFITIHLTENAIVFTDDGCGIADPSILLSIAKSGWEEAIQRAEAPYGAGFLAALFACESINVRSKDYSLSANTKDLLALKPAEVVGGYSDAGTTSIALMRPHKSVQDLRHAVLDAAKGFPVPIQLITPNEVQEVARPDAKDDTWIDVGPGYVNFESLMRKGGSVGTLYLQGLPVGHQSHWGSPMHLKSELFRGRMPDRDCLIDHYAALINIEAAVRTFLQERCTKELAETTDLASKQAWQDRWMECARLKDRRILASVGFLPASWFNEWNPLQPITPGDLGQEFYDWQEQVEGDIPRLIPSKGYSDRHGYLSIAAMLERGVFEASDDNDATSNVAAAFAALKGGLFPTTSLDDVFSDTLLAKVNHIDCSEIEVVWSGEHSSADISSDYVDRTLHRVAELTLVHEMLGSVVVPEGTAIAKPNGGLYFRGTCDASSIARSASTYLSEDDGVIEDVVSDTEDAIEDALALLDSATAETHLSNLVRKAGYTAKTELKNKSFTIRFDTNGEATITAL
jgi:hypothetical protein